MTSGDWVALIGIFLGAGGIGGAIVTAVSNRKKIQADCVATLSNAYETRLGALGKRITAVEDENKLLKDNINELEAEIDELKSALQDRELLIMTLQKENADLQTQVDKLSKVVNNKDRRIRELEKQVAELTSRLDAMNGNADGCESG